MTKRKKIWITSSIFLSLSSLSLGSFVLSCKNTNELVVDYTKLLQAIKSAETLVKNNANSLEIAELQKLLEKVQKELKIYNQDQVDNTVKLINDLAESTAKKFSEIKQTKHSDSNEKQGENINKEDNITNPENIKNTGDNTENNTSNTDTKTQDNENAPSKSKTDINPEHADHDRQNYFTQKLNLLQEFQIFSSLVRTNLLNFFAQEKLKPLYVTNIEKTLSKITLDFQNDEIALQDIQNQISNLKSFYNTEINESLTKLFSRFEKLINLPKDDNLNQEEWNTFKSKLSKKIEDLKRNLCSNKNTISFIKLQQNELENFVKQQQPHSKDIELSSDSLVVPLNNILNAKIYYKNANNKYESISNLDSSKIPKNNIFIEIFTQNHTFYFPIIQISKFQNLLKVSFDISNLNLVKTSEFIFLPLGNQQPENIKNLNQRNVDFSKNDAYKENNLVAYQNVSLLAPFLTEEQTISLANKIDIKSNIACKKITSVVPLNENEVVVNLNKNHSDINRILIRYEDGFVEKVNVSLENNANLQKRYQYKISGLDLYYQPLVSNLKSDNIIKKVKDDFMSLDFSWQQIKNHFNLDSNFVDVSSSLHLQKTILKNKQNIVTILEDILESNAIAANSEDITSFYAQKLAQNSFSILFNYSYFDRWYSIDFAGIHLTKLLIFYKHFWHIQTTSLLDWLIEVSQVDFSFFKPELNVEMFLKSLATKLDKKSLFDFIVDTRKMLVPNLSNNEWLKQSSKAYIVEAFSSDSELKILQMQANQPYSIGVFDRISDSKFKYRQMLLPLLTLSKESMYIISTLSSLSFGSYERYFDLNDNVNVQNNIQNIHTMINNAAKWQSNYFDFWYHLLNKQDRTKLFDYVNTFDGYLFVKQSNIENSEGWQDLNSSCPSIEEFFSPINKGIKYLYTAGAYAISHENYFTFRKILTADGHAIFTHETTHNLDGSTYFLGYGRRSGMGAEAYAQGLLQNPMFDESIIGINFSFETDFNNRQRYQVSNPLSKFSSDKALQNYMHNVFDFIYLTEYLEAKSLLKQPLKTKKILFFQVSNQLEKINNDYSHANNVIDMNLSDDFINNLKTVDDLVDNNIVSIRNQNRKTSFFSRNEYNEVSLTNSIWAALDNPKGAPGSFMFKRMAFELLAYKGYYNGFIPYVSNQLAIALKDYYDQKIVTDKQVFDAILKDEFNSWSDFKKTMYNNAYKAAQNFIKPITINYELGKEITDQQIIINNVAQLENLINQAITYDNKNLTLAKLGSGEYDRLKKLLFKAYLFATNDFRTSMFKK
ncbi:ZmpA/ZmpB/ZmpC family metallo-endopeptidase [Mycoplasma sp. 4044]